MNQTSLQHFDGLCDIVRVIRGTQHYRPEQSDLYPFDDDEAAINSESFGAGFKTLHGDLSGHEPTVDLDIRTKALRTEKRGVNAISVNVRTFCNHVQAQVASLRGRIDSLRRNVGTTHYSLQGRLKELQRKNDACEVAATHARLRLRQWLIERKAEVRSEIDRQIADHDSRFLDQRAINAEHFAELAMALAEAAIDDAEHMILEAVASRHDADLAAVAAVALRGQ